MLLRLRPGLLLHRMIPSNMFALFRVFTLVVVAAMASSLLARGSQSIISIIDNIR